VRASASASASASVSVGMPGDGAGAPGPGGPGCRWARAWGRVCARVLVRACACVRARREDRGGGIRKRDEVGEGGVRATGRGVR
jgi:hypothetical protein